MTVNASTKISTTCLKENPSIVNLKYVSLKYAFSETNDDGKPQSNIKNRFAEKNADFTDFFLEKAA